LGGAATRIDHPVMPFFSALIAAALLVAAPAGAGAQLPDDGPGVVNPDTPPPVVGGCQIFPAENAWNRDISGAPVDPNSKMYIKYMGEPAGRRFHVRIDAGPKRVAGIPWTLVPFDQQLAPLRYGVGGENYRDESDPGPFPIPHDAPLEGGSTDSHAIVLRQGDCKLFETYRTVREGTPDAPRFRVSASAVWDLTTNHTRPATWTSADAAGLPIFPGLLRREELEADAINHALRWAAPNAQRAYTAPASHFGPNRSRCYPPYGLRLRVKASFDESSFSPQAQVLIRALKRFGLIYADQGFPFITGASDPAIMPLVYELNEHPIPSRALEVVQPGRITRGYRGGRCRRP
jgi:hypothetical protein